jgi:hypothetical protein
MLLKKITKIEHITDEESDNFAITFYFAPNDLFNNSHLTVKFYMENDKDPKKTECSEIQWRENGMDYFLKTINSKNMNKKTGVTKMITKTVERETFFSFFRTINPYDPNSQEEHVR